MSGLLAAAIGIAAAGLGSVLADVTWWFAMMAVAVTVLLAAALTRSFARRPLWASLAAAVAAIGTLTLMFAPGTALLGVIPTFDTVGAFRELNAAGVNSIAIQDLPADADRGILYLMCLGVAVIAVATDTLVFTLRTPAFAGVPVLALLIVPTLVDPEFEDAFIFALAAAVYCAILLFRVRPAGRGAAIGIAGAAVVAALVVPLALPGVQPGAQASGAAGSLSTGINPIITLGNDLRRGEPTVALTYTTTEPGGNYLRLTALDDFSGRSWEPTPTDLLPANEVTAIGPAPGLGADVPVTVVSTDITVENVLSRWLPAPYAPTSVTGLVGDWSWEADALAIRSDRSSARGQQYQVTSQQIAPSIDQLLATGTTVDAGFERYLELPGDLAQVVERTAAEVVGTAATNYEKAIALQEFFRDGEFEYSEDAPVQNGYDGTGEDVLAAFLEARSGYCVHFSSAMATMARTLGIPSRVAVGFTPGTLVTRGGSDPFYEVTTHDLHAWPELYFSGIGWVRFEPTPGRGQVPAFAPLTVDDPATPDVDESVPPPAPTAAPTTAPSAAPEDAVVPDAAPVAAGDAAEAGPPYGAIVVALLLLVLATPFAVRSIRRSRRLGLVERGSATAAWDEVRDTADDLGLRTADSRTPRQLVEDLDGHLDRAGQAALDRLRGALESEAFAEARGAPDPDDVRAVVRSLGSRAGIRARIIGTLAPRSLVVGWLPAVQTD